METTTDAIETTFRAVFVYANEAFGASYRPHRADPADAFADGERMAETMAHVEGTVIVEQVDVITIRREVVTIDVPA